MEPADTRAFVMNRAEWQQLARDHRIQDAKSLLAAKRWSGAYYLAGYAVEAGLKACVLAFVERTGVIFEDRKYAEKCWTHDLVDLLKLSGLEAALRADGSANPALGNNWLVVSDWSETNRYRFTPHHKAKKLFQAVTDKANGVLPWIMNRW
jgi:hypothetical protein